MGPGTRNALGAISFHVALSFLAPSRVAAQPTAECPTSQCAATAPAFTPAYSPLWREAASIHQLKLEFVDALQQFTRAEAGTFGDEGAALRGAIVSMRDALSRWDGAIRQFQAGASRLTRDAEVHVALATVFLDRHRVEDALRELKTAESRDAGRADLYTLRALALGVSGRTAEAVRALRSAAAIDPDNPTTFYALAQYLADLNQPADATRARESLQRALRRSGGTTNPGGAAAAPFERVDLLRQVAGTAPLFPHARYTDGFAALGTGDYATAVARLDAASTGDPLVSGDRDVRHQMVQAAASLREGRLDAALQQLQTLVATAPDHAEAHRLLGLAFWIDDQPGKSIEQLRSAIRLAPGDERARVTLADVLVANRRMAEAERELTQAIDAGVRSGQVHYRLAQLYERQSLLPQAATAYHESQRFGPVVGRDQFYRTLGSLLVNQADFRGALAAYSQRIQANPNSGEAHRQRGEVCFLQGRHDEALAEFSVAAWLDPADARAHAGAGQAYVRLLNYGEAVEAFRRALALDVSMREARYGLATSLRRLGKNDEAGRELEMFERQQAEAESAGQRDFQVDALRRQASRESLAGKHDRAITLFHEVLRLNPGDARPHRDLGFALLRAQRADEAIDHLETAQQLEETAEGFAYLADAYTSAGRREEGARQRARYQESIRRAKVDRIRELAR